MNIESNLSNTALMSRRLSALPASSVPSSFFGVRIRFLMVLPVSPMYLRSFSMAARNFARIALLWFALMLERQESGKSILLLIFWSLRPSEVS